MSEEYHNPRIHTVKLDEIDPKEVIVVMEACAGAMADWCIPESNEDVYGVYTCVYNGREYYFGVGREEVPITEDMRQNGVWYVYTWAD